MECRIQINPLFNLFEERDLKSNQNLTITVGSLIADKNHEETIRFIAGFEGEYLLIFGEGPDRNRLQKIIYLLGVEDRIFLCGVVSRETLAFMYNFADTFISSSKHEGYGLALREAKASGCTVRSYTGDGRTLNDVDIDLGNVKEKFEIPRLKKTIRTTKVIIFCFLFAGLALGMATCWMELWK